MYLKRTCTQNVLVTTVLDHRYSPRTYHKDAHAGVFNKHKLCPVKEIPPPARPFGAGRGGFLCPWPYNNGDRVNANSPHGPTVYQYISVSPSFLCSILFFSLSITRALTKNKGLYNLKYSFVCSCTNDENVCREKQG